MAIGTVAQYWPAIVAALYLLYVAASAAQTGNASQVVPAIAALITAIGVTNVSVAAGAKASLAHRLVETVIKPPTDPPAK